MSFRQEWIGSIKVKSGRLVILDPADANEWDGQMDLRSKFLAFNTDEQGGQLVATGATPAEGGVVFAADDEQADVFANYDEKGRIASVEIRILEDE